MIRVFFIFISLLIFEVSFGQESERLHEMGKNYLVDGDFSNAESLLTRALALDTNNQSIVKDLALCLYFEKDYNKALEYIQPFIDKEEADDQSFQITGNIYRALNRIPECEQLFRKGIKKFNGNGVMYNELGETLWLQNKEECIEYWEKGIEKDPSYVKNYTNASRFYYSHNQPLWTVIYGEVSVNMDPLNKKTPELKEIIYRSYQKLLSDLAVSGIGKDRSRFEKKVLSNLYKQKDLMNQGFNTSVFTMIRTRFILDWYQESADKYPFQLFEHHRYLLQNGLFESYNRWLFGSTENLSAFQNWTQLHDREYADFIQFQNSNLFKIPTGQFYK